MGLKIGYAWSVNNLDWTMYEEVVITGEEGWELGSIHQADVLLVDDTYKMWYIGASILGTKIGYAEGYTLETLCMTDGVTFTSQSQIDAFIQNHPYCAEIGGDVTINGDDIENLNGLHQIQTIDGYLEVNYNNILEDFSGMDSLKKIMDDFMVFNNSEMTSFNGLDKLSYVHDDLMISYHDKLESLDGLQELVYVGDDIYIDSNWLLEDIAALDGLDTSSFNSLSITGNNSLSFCHIKSVCDFLSVYYDDVEIDNNKGDCKDKEIVEIKCKVGVVESDPFEDILVYPNPFSGELTLEYTLLNASDVELTIFNYLGKQIDLIRKPQSSGKHQLKWDSKALPAGMYFCVLKTVDGTRTVKIVKM
jgi:hypothetical protein